MKRIAAISDIHIKHPNDPSDKLLMNFFQHPKVQDSDYILLLGDIYDLMCGPHDQYLDLYAHHFKEIDLLIKKNKKVYFFEGNHDVHLENLFKKFWPQGGAILSQVPVVEKIDGKIYYFSHGDEHEIDNVSYQRYISFIRSAPLKFVANFLMPYSVLHYVGEYASKRSRKKGARIFNEDVVRKRFRNGVENLTTLNYDFIIGGHSHVKDLYVLPGTSSIYLNNGYALNSKTFIYINNHQPEFVNFY